MTTPGKIITVFGGTGFVGRHLIWQLARTGAQIRVATRVKQRGFFLRPAGDVGQVIPVACDIHSDASVRAALQGATHAVNLTGIIAEKGKKGTFQKVHVEASERIARLSREAGIETLVHVSALGASPDASSRYARSKAEGESKAIHAFSQTVVLRPSVIFGPEDKFFNLFASVARDMRILPLLGGGRTKMQPVYVADVAKAIVNVITAGNPAKHHGHIYDLAGPRVYTFRELLEAMKSVTRQDACFFSLPFPIAKVMAVIPFVPLTCDQVNALKSDSVSQSGAPGFKELGVEPASVESVLPGYLLRYLPGGAFGEKRQAS